MVWVRRAVPSGRGCDLSSLGQAFLLESAGDKEGEFEGLAGIEAWIAMGVITVGQGLVRYRFCAAGAFGHVLARHFEMHAAGMSSLRLMDGEEAAHLGQDALEGPGFVTRGGVDGIAMHGI